MRCTSRPAETLHAHKITAQALGSSSPDSPGKPSRNMKYAISKTCSAPSQRAGLTLIEVIAAIAILGTLLVGIVLARTQHTRQLALATRKDAAIQAADELIASWWTNQEGIPINSSGYIPTDSTFAWRTQIIPNPEIEQTGAQAVRIEITDTSPTLPQHPSINMPLVTVEVVLPIEEPEQQEEQYSNSGSNQSSTTYTTIERITPQPTEAGNRNSTSTQRGITRPQNNSRTGARRD